MEVMNRSELTQTDILVGQKSTTRSFGVSDDPMLMSMLSTGFYQNPLRTMIQEVMFNAWDAHRMGNCQHRPIDIYINDTTGLIIRDYGPGIEPGENDDNMHEIYCMYGGSTKRKLKNQTGGFGLGSKSPFAYTESFTVTSHFGGTKNMYLISRVSESNGGKPGMTSLVRVPTTETGLMVTVPLKSGHMTRAYDHVKDILFLSGIKAMIHYENNADEFIDSDSLTAGQYRVSPDREEGNIYAVYGGVRYLIPNNEEYRSEYGFMKLMAKDHDVFVGFAPDTLSPLPNREGLNMGEKSKENIKANFEICMEKFYEIFEPVMKSLIASFLGYVKGLGLQGAFGLIKASTYGFSNSCTDLRSFLPEQMSKAMPAGTNKDVWDIAVNIAIHQTKSMVDMLHKERYKTLFIAEFIKQYPECKDLAFAVRKASLHDVFGAYNNAVTIDFVSEFYAAKFLRDQNNFYRAIKKAYPDDNTLHPAMRLYMKDNWIHPITDRAKANLSETKYGVRNIKADDPRLVRGETFTNLEKLYDKDGNQTQFLMMDKTIILAKTLTSLKNAMIPPYVMRHRDTTKRDYRYYGGVSIPVPGYVVHERKGAYAKALDYLTKEGFTVIEGEPVEKKEYVPKKKIIPTYSLIHPKYNDTWQSTNPNDQITDPTHLFYATQTMLKDRYYGDNKPEHHLVFWFLKKNPKTVMIHNTKVADKLEKDGVVQLHNAILYWYENLSADKDRMTNIIRASKIDTLSNMHSDILRNPMLQLELGMDPVDPKDTEFWYESSGLTLLTATKFNLLTPLRKRIEKETQELWNLDPERQNIKKMCVLSNLFNQSEISSLWSSTNDHNKPALVDKIIATMKLFG
jgi:hypothetical protein